jgi:hypothetical protein
MVEVGLAEYFGIGEALGIIGTMFVILYFSRKHIQRLTVDIETKVLNDLEERMQSLTKKTVDRPELIKIISKDEPDWTPEMAFVYEMLFTFSHAYHMRQRKVLRDNEWTGWLRRMRNCFEEGKIMEYWKSGLELEKWFDPAFEDFINKEIIPTVKNK